MNPEPKLDSSVPDDEGALRKPIGMPRPDVSKMGFNPANFAYRIGEEPWVPEYSVCYAISFYDARTGVESERSDWWGPKSDPKKLYGGFGLDQNSNGLDRAGNGAPHMAQVRRAAGESPGGAPTGA